MCIQLELGGMTCCKTVPQAPNCKFNVTQPFLVERSNLLKDKTGRGGRETPDCHPVGQRGTTEFPTFSFLKIYVNCVPYKFKGLALESALLTNLIIASRGGREN